MMFYISILISLIILIYLISNMTMYGKVSEEISMDIPPPLEKYVTLSHYDNANLCHDLNTGRSVTGILYVLNQTPIGWFSKKHVTV